MAVWTAIRSGEYSYNKTVMLYPKQKYAKAVDFGTIRTMALRRGVAIRGLSQSVRKTNGRSRKLYSLIVLSTRLRNVFCLLNDFMTTPSLVVRRYSLNLMEKKGWILSIKAVSSR